MSKSMSGDTLVDILAVAGLGGIGVGCYLCVSLGLALLVVGGILLVVGLAARLWSASCNGPK